MKLAQRGKPLCAFCKKLATYASCSFSRGVRGYVYCCGEHKHLLISGLIGVAHLRELFTAHLMAHLDVVVGRPADECDCPLAQFLSSYWGVRCSVTLSCEVVSLDQSLSFGFLPDWAVAFIDVLDITCLQDSVTGQQVLDLLEGVQA